MKEPGPTRPGLGLALLLGGATAVFGAYFFRHGGMAPHPDLAQILFLSGLVMAVVGLIFIQDALMIRPRELKVATQEAARLGFQQASLATLRDRGFENLPVFELPGRARGLFHGQTHGRATILCRYVTYGKRPQTYTVACFRMGAGFPEFVLRGEGIGDKVASLFGKRDISFDTHPLFSKSYHLRGQNEAAVRALFQPSVLSFFEGEGAGWGAESLRGWLGVHQGRRPVTSSELPTFLDEARRVCALFAAPR